MESSEMQPSIGKASFISLSMIVMCIFLAGAAALFWLVTGIITHHFGMIILTILFAFLLIILVRILRSVNSSNQRKSIFTSLISVLFACAVAVFILKFPSGFNSNLPRMYQFDKKYAEMKHGNSSVAWFPETLPDQISDYHLSYLPGMMQGTGHFTVQFTCSPEDAKQIAESYAAKAIYTIPLKNMNNSMTYQVEKISPKESPNGVGFVNVMIDNGEWYGHKEIA